MSWNVKGSEGPNSPRSSGLSSEGGKEISFSERLDHILSQRHGKMSVSVRQTECRDAPLDGGKTGKRMQDSAAILKEMKGTASALWESFKLGVRGLGEMLGLLRVGTVKISQDSRSALQGEIEKFKNSEAGFLRSDNSFSRQMVGELRSRMDGKVMQSVIKELELGGKDAPEGEFQATMMGRDEAAVLVRLTTGLVDATLGGGGKPSLARALPEGWVGGLRDAARDINQSDLSEGKKKAAIRTMVKDLVFLRFITPEIAKSVTDPAPRAANALFLTLVNEAGGARFSPELREAWEPLRQGFSQRLDDFIRELNLPGQDG